MRDDTRRDLAFWGVAGLAVALFVWVYSQAANGDGDFADPPPSLAPFAATQSSLTFVGRSDAGAHPFTA